MYTTSVINISMHNTIPHFRLTKEYEKCEIIILPKKYNLQLFTIGIQKDSPYLGLFNYYLRKMRQDGSLDKNVKDYFAVPQACPDNTDKALGFNNLIFPVFILILGCLFSFVTLMFEVIYNRVSKQAKKDTNSTNVLEENNELRTEVVEINNDNVIELE